MSGQFTTEIPEGLTVVSDRQEIPEGLTVVSDRQEIPEGLTVVSDRQEIPEGLTVISDRTTGEMVVQPSPAPVSDPTPISEAIVDQSSIGRIMDAIGEGAADGWGEGNLGLSDETRRWLIEAGIFPKKGEISPIRAFNQGVILPLAAAADALIRGGNAALYGLARAAGEIADETGLSDVVGLPGKKLSRDLIALSEVTGIVFGQAPTRFTTGKAPKSGSREAILALTNNAARRIDKSLPAKIDVPDELVLETPLVDKAGNINLKNLNTPEDVKQVIRDVAAQNDDFIIARRGVVSHEETLALADAAGITVNDIRKRKIGQALNPEEITAYRQALVQSAEDVLEKSRKAASGSHQDLLDFYEAELRHRMIQEQLSGATAEAGRTLNALKIKIKGAEGAEALSDVINTLDPNLTIAERAKRIRSLDSPEKVSKFIEDSRKATTSEMVIEAWINALLSGPQTHATNIASNMLIAALSIPENLIASGVGRVLRHQDRIYAREALGEIAAIGQGALDGIRAGARAYMTETPTDMASKLEMPRLKSIPSKKIGTIKGVDIEIGGRQVRIPGRLLMAEDEFFKAIGYRQEINAAAIRQATKEKLKGRQFKERVAELVNNPTKQIRDAAEQRAEYQTFTKALGPMGQAVQKFAGGHPLMRIPLTFIRTPTNILKYAGERSILSVFSKEVRASLKGQRGEIQQSRSIARIIMGSSIAVGAYKLAAEGMATGGGPTDPKERALMYATGWQPYSLKIGNTYYSYNRFGGFGNIIGIVADMHDIADRMTDPEADDIAMLITASIAKNVTSQTWTKSASDIIEAVSDPDRYGERYIQKLAGTVIPTGVAQVSRINDPYLREINSIMDAIKSRTPYSTELPYRRDRWGEPIKLGGSFGPDLISPIYVSKVNQDPVNIELKRLGIFPAPVPKNIRGVELTPKQYEDFQIYAGRSAKMQLDSVIGQDGWSSLPDFAKREYITKIIDRTLDMSRKVMLIKYPDIMRQVYEARMEELK